MAFSNILLSGLFVIISGIAIYETWVLAENNGTFDAMRTIRDKGPHYLPGTREPLRKFYTGTSFIDYQLQVLAVFFWPLLTGEHPAGSIHTGSFSGQFAAGYVLCLIEGMRRGNRWTLFSYVVIWGLLFQTFSFAVCVPLLFATYFATSPLVGRTSIDDHLPHAAEAAMVPFSTLIGYWFTAALMSSPFPKRVDSDTKQVYMALWQFFPLWIGILQQFGQRLLGLSTTLSRSSRSTSLWTLRLAYAFALVMAAFTHISSVTQAMSYDKHPSLFRQNPENYSGLIDIFVPATYHHQYKISRFADGPFLFLQWDYIIGSAATLLWSIFVSARTQAWSDSKLGPVVILLTSVFATVAAGPVGCATILIWIKDEILVEQAVAEDKKTK